MELNELRVKLEQFSKELEDRGRAVAAVTWSHMSEEFVEWLAKESYYDDDDLRRPY